MKPGLTLAMIAKNEEAKLGRCLSSVADAVDEIVLVDTGSTDRTVEIAASAGARVTEFEWIGDFSAARNEANRHIETEWALWLDADEWLPPESVPLIREAIERLDVAGHFLIRRDIMEDGSIAEMELPRLWRHDTSIRFEGVVHEQFPRDVMLSRKWGHPRIRFCHDGFAELSAEKKRRNLELLRSAVKLNPNDLYYRLCLVDLELDLDEPGAAEEFDAILTQVLQMDEPTEGMITWLLSKALQRTPTGQLYSSKTERVIKRGWSWFPNSPTVMWAIAMTEMRRGDKLKGYRALKQIEHLSLSGESFGLESFNPDLLGRRLWRVLGEVAAEVGDQQTAATCKVRLLASP
jgi:glycosyltransferase involved in cell wall biosynthesis